VAIRIGAVTDEHNNGGRWILDRGFIGRQVEVDAVREVDERASLARFPELKLPATSSTLGFWRPARCSGATRWLREHADRRIGARRP